MSSPLPLAGRKIAVLVKSQYIPGEIKIYQERFAGYGATVDFVSRLWGQPKLKFYSTVEPEGENVPTIEWLEVSPTSVRLRSTEAPINSSTTADVARRAPAVQFFRRAMQNPRIILEAYNRTLDQAVQEIDKYDAILIVDGSGAIVDLVNNQRVHDLILAFLCAGKPVGAECYAIVDYPFITGRSTPDSVLTGQKIIKVLDGSPPLRRWAGNAIWPGAGTRRGR